MLRIIISTFRKFPLNCFFIFPVSVILLIMLFNCTEQKNPFQGEQSDSTASSKLKWTFLFYDDADFTMAYDPLDDFSVMVQSGDSVNYLVLQDRNDDQAKLWYINNNHQPVLIKELGEINMAGPDALSNFLNYAKINYPAERVILSVYDHGGGCWGSCIDVTNGDEALTMEEMKSGILSGGGVDMVLFSGPCLMGSLESVYELRNCTDIYIGSENNSSYIYWKWAMKAISDSLNIHPDISSKELARSIIGNIYKYRSAAGQYANELTMCAVETAGIENLVQTIDDVAVGYLNQGTDFIPLMDSLSNIISFVKKSYMDVYDFADQFLLLESGEEMRGKFDAIKQAYTDVIIAECHGANWPNAHGLSIYFPYENTLSGFDFYVSNHYSLDLVQNSNWDELLYRYGVFQNNKGKFKKLVKPWEIRGDGLNFPID